MWVTFALISMKLYSPLLKIFKPCIYKFYNFFRIQNILDFKIKFTSLNKLLLMKI